MSSSVDISEYLSRAWQGPDRDVYREKTQDLLNILLTGYTLLQVLRHVYRYLESVEQTANVNNLRDAIDELYNNDASYYQEMMMIEERLHRFLGLLGKCRKDATDSGWTELEHYLNITANLLFNHFYRTKGQVIEHDDWPFEA